MLKHFAILLCLALSGSAFAEDVDVPQADWGLEEVTLDLPEATQTIEVKSPTGFGHADGPPVDLLRGVQFGLLAVATSGDGVNLLAITGAR